MTERPSAGLEIAGYAAELIACETAPVSCRTRRSPSIELYAVADLDTVVDGDELLRETTALEPPYWALVWIGARAIAARLLDAPPARNCRVLDLGCGLGLSGLAAALGGAHVTFADQAEEPLQFVRATLAHHRLTNARTRRLDFTADELAERFELVLAADIVYDPEHYRALVDFLDAHLEANGTILLTESLRADARQVIDMLTRRSMRLDTQAVWVVEESRRERTWLHTLVREPA